MRSYRKLLSFLLIFALLLGALPVSAYAAAQGAECAPVLDIRPERAEYQKGEDIEIKTRLYNNSLNDLYNVYLWVEYDSGDALLYPKATERVVDRLAYTKTSDLSFRIGCLKYADNIEALNSPGITSLTARIVRLLPKLTKFFVFLKNDIRLIFSSFATLWKPRYSASLGDCTVIYDGREIHCVFKCRYTLTTSPAKVQATPMDKGIEQANVKITAPKNGFAGMVFGADIERDGGFAGWLFYINAYDGSAGIVEKIQTEFKSVARRKVDIQAGHTYTMCVQRTAGGVKAWLLNSISEKDTAFPLFDIAITLSRDEWGLLTATDGTYSDFRSGGEQYRLPEETYCNPVHTGAPDPFVLYENGVYYLYSTNAPKNGFYADVSTDLVHWTRHGQLVADKKDLYGEYNFWAPEVYNYNGTYYMFYSAEEHIAVATADSPLGPFKKAGEGFLFPERSIDGSLFFDDDGKIYLYYAHMTSKTEDLYVVEMEPDLLRCKENTKTRLSVPEGWENNINEGPAVLKHNGTYYLTYSGSNYEDVNYSIGCMTSDSPTGPFVRNAVNPVLQSNLITLGCGHHCFATSPDGSELFIVYHCHRSKDAVHPRDLCIDRVRFVPSENGADRLEAGGPTSTPQPMPGQ